MTLPPLPIAFVRRITEQLGGASPAYFEALEQPAHRGLRANPLKFPDVSLDLLVEGLGSLIPWEPNGRCLPLDSTAGLLPLHEAGAYYLQEPSAMIPATILNGQPCETLLDLCAAPGGKSTQLAAAMAGQGTLVCNEPVPSRAQILSRNLERMGVTNALVVSADPAQLAEIWPLLFDGILVDAPCSGEGMFRRHPEARLEWNEDSPSRCASRQMRILESACAMLKVGGRLCYSTCTFNQEENEDTIAQLLSAHPELEPIEFSVPIGNDRALTSHSGCLHLYPHEISGEGHFVALLRKQGLDQDMAVKPCTMASPALAFSIPAKPAVAAFNAFWQEISQAPAPMPNATFGETLLCAPSLPPVRGIRVLRAGLALGQNKGKIFIPDHALAMAAPALSVKSVSLSEPDAYAYQRGEAIPAPDDLRGFYTVQYHGLSLGFAKASDGWLKNHYPKGLRRP